MKRSSKAHKKRAKPDKKPAAKSASKAAVSKIKLAAEQEAAARVAAISVDKLVAALRHKRMTTAELCAKFEVDAERMGARIREMQERGVLIFLVGEHWGVERVPPTDDKGRHTYHSRPDGTYLFGFGGDNHLGSKYERLDCLNDLYDRFAEEGVDRAFNAGNWIDGEARFNVYDLHTHGMDAQLEYMADVYPQRDGIVTYAVAGDDHEGWYGDKQGIDIGRHAQNVMRAAGRTDWVNVGYMESFIDLVDARSGKSAKLLLCHPGGGSAYALSYTTQKSVEMMDGGEKPAVAIFGHYHKLWHGNIRNVWCLQSGCTQDQTRFMRKRRIDAHVGGGVCKLTQDERTGAIVRCRVEFFRYFNRGYYNGRWSTSGSVVQAERKIA